MVATSSAVMTDCSGEMRGAQAGMVIVNSVQPWTNMVEEGEWELLRISIITYWSGGMKYLEWRTREHHSQRVGEWT